MALIFECYTLLRSVALYFMKHPFAQLNMPLSTSSAVKNSARGVVLQRKLASDAH